MRKHALIAEIRRNFERSNRPCRSAAVSPRGALGAEHLNFASRSCATRYLSKESLTDAVMDRRNSWTRPHVSSPSRSHVALMYSERSPAILITGCRPYETLTQVCGQGIPVPDQ